MLLKRKSEPEFRKGPLQKKNKKRNIYSHFLTARASKTDPKMDSEI